MNLQVDAKLPFPKVKETVAPPLDQINLHNYTEESLCIAMN